MKNKIEIKRKISIACKILKAKWFKKYIPLTVSWIITRKCNLNCIYCDMAANVKKEIDTKQVFLIINALASCGTERISFTGGEPLLREDIGEIINYAKSKGILSVINTNGLLLSEHIDKIKNVSRVSFSLDGSEESHNKNRPVNSFNRVIEAIQICALNKIPVVITMVLTKNNLDCIDFCLTVAEKYNAKILFQPAQIYILGTNKKNSQIPEVTQYKNTISKLISKKKSGNIFIYNSLPGLRHLSFWPGSKLIPCFALKLHCRIDCDGSLYPCGHMENIKAGPSSDYHELFKGNYFNNLKFFGCDKCWCASMVEFNLISSFNIEALLNIINEGL